MLMTCVCSAPQLPVWESACAVPPGPDPGFSGCGDVAVFAAEILCDWTALQKTAHREQGQQGDTGAGDHCFCLLHANGWFCCRNVTWICHKWCVWRVSIIYLLRGSTGDGLPVRFYGAGLFPGRGSAVHTGTHQHRRGHGVHRANQGLPGHHLLCLYWSDPAVSWW